MCNRGKSCSILQAIPTRQTQAISAKAAASQCPTAPAPNAAWGQHLPASTTLSTAGSAGETPEGEQGPCRIPPPKKVRLHSTSCIPGLLLGIVVLSPWLCSGLCSPTDVPRTWPCPCPSKERWDRPRGSTKGSTVGRDASRGLGFQMNIDSANYRPPCRQLISLSQKDGIELKARGIHGAQQDAPQTAQRTRQANNLQQN